MIKDAYIAGFCKAAEAAGVDPVMLAKRAGARDAVTRVLGRMFRGKGVKGVVDRGLAVWGDESTASGFIDKVRALVGR